MDRLTDCRIFSLRYSMSRIQFKEKIRAQDSERSGPAERFRPPCTRDRKGFHVKLQDLTQMLRDFIRGDHRTKLDNAL
jgi:hypothetical protein